jgi:plastocyanin
MRRFTLLALLTVLAVGSVRASAAPKPTLVKITIHDMAFAPTPANARVGDTIEWTNLDVVDHTATAAKGAWDVKIPAGKTARVVMKSAGAFDYYCRFHPNMRATVIVKPPR